MPRLRELSVPYLEADGIRDRSFSPGDVITMKKLIAPVGADIVHTHGCLSGRIAAKALGAKTVLTRHSAFPFPAWVRKTPARLLYRFIYGHYADKIIAVSPAGAQIMYDFGIPKVKVAVMMNGAEALRPLTQAERREARHSWGVEDGTFLLGAVARLEEYKGHRCMLEALRLLLDRGRDVKLLIAGTGSYEDTLRSLASDLGDKVIFSGFARDVAVPLGAMDLQLNASYESETSSLSIIEGMSIGLPAVASDICGNPYLIEDRVSGLLFTPQDPRDLAEKISEIMDSPSLRDSLSRGARRRYEESFTGEIYARSIEKVYQEM